MKKVKLVEVSISFGDDLKDDFLIDVEGLSKQDVKILVLDAVREALKKDKRVKDFTVCN